MGLLQALGLSRDRGRRQARVVARYDAAQTNESNRRHWANADALSADAALDPNVRATLRNRSRYECANNSYAAGIVRTLGDDTIGTGCRLQITADDRAANTIVEQSFARWADAINLQAKLRLIRMTRARDGEAFVVLVNNPRLREMGLPSLDLQIIEADQVYAPFGAEVDAVEPTRNIDGVIVDSLGIPTAYTIAEVHPGSNAGIASGLGRFRRLPASQVIHYYRPERPGQHRGVPELTPALPLFAQLRRYTLAVLGAAETAATFAGILYTDAPAGGEAEAVEPLDPISLERQSLLTMPMGWRMEQVRAEQPTTTYAMFKSELLNEIARCLSMPFNVATGNSSNYNYASGRLDHQVYFKAIEVERDVIRRLILEPILAAWLREAVLLEEAIPPRYRSMSRIPHQWMWPAWPHVDPQKEAAASNMRLSSGLATYAAEFAAQGLDWEAEFRQRAREQALAQELGLATLGPQQDMQEPDEDEVTVDPDEDDEDDEDATEDGRR